RREWLRRSSAAENRCLPPRPGLLCRHPLRKGRGRSYFKGANMRWYAGWLGALLVLGAAGGLYSHESKGWVELVNGKDETGWKLRSPTVTVTRFLNAENNPIEGAKRVKVDQKEEARDAKGKAIEGAKIVEKDGKKVVVDAEGKVIDNAKIAKVGGRDAIVDKTGAEVKGAKAIPESIANTSGWTVEGDALVCSKPHGGNDLLTEKKFTDFELHIEFLGTSNSGVYLQGRYEIQVDNSFGKEATKHSCGALYGLIAPS